METYSTISFKAKDGKLYGTYCQNDGNIEGVGIILRTFYNNPKEARALVALGDKVGGFKSVGITLDECRHEGSVLRYSRADYDDNLTLFIKANKKAYNYCYDEECEEWFVVKERYDTEVFDIEFALLRNLVADELADCLDALNKVVKQRNVGK